MTDSRTIACEKCPPESQTAATRLVSVALSTGGSSDNETHNHYLCEAHFEEAGGNFTVTHSVDLVAQALSFGLRFNFEVSMIDLLQPARTAKAA